MGIPLQASRGELSSGTAKRSPDAAAFPLSIFSHQLAALNPGPPDPSGANLEATLLQEDLGKAQGLGNDCRAKSALQMKVGSPTTT